jgi:alpha-ketoglutarate-dependent taurine dioxygenase
MTPKVGSEVDIAREVLLRGTYAQELRTLLEARGVLVFRGLALTKDEQRVFARTLGDVLSMGDEGIQPISLDKEKNATADYLRGSFYWHIDGASDDIPTRASILTAVTLSPEGGDTLFCNTYTAYDALSDDDKVKFEKLKVVHSLETSQYYVTPEPSYAELMRWRTYPPKIHPLVWTHRSGRKSLVLGMTASHIVDVPLADGRGLLCRLRDEATRADNIYVHKWTPGDTIMWDNTGVMHRVTPYAIDSGRMMNRTTLAGEEPLV